MARRMYWLVAAIPTEVDNELGHHKMGEPRIFIAGC